ncbi:MAG: Cys-tRNA(Pro) deacylase [Breznakibacter sp.]
MAQKINKTNAARLLDQAKVNYNLVPYQVDEENLAADHVANQLGEDISVVFKTLVLRGDKNGVFVCVVPGDCEVDLKKVAKLSGNKKAEMLGMKELLPTTGYIRGGCSPLGMKKSFPTLIHESCNALKRIYISAGVRGLQIVLHPGDLIRVTRAEVYDLVVDTAPQD